LAQNVDWNKPIGSAGGAPTLDHQIALLIAGSHYPVAHVVELFLNKHVAGLDFRDPVKVVVDGNKSMVWDVPDKDFAMLVIRP
jgi:hypothetical protein